MVHFKNLPEKNKEKRRLKPEVTTPKTPPDSESVGGIYVITGGPSNSKDKNKRVTEEILSVE